MDRPETQHHYAIRGGKDGKNRLDLLARVLQPTTLELLDRVGLGRGMKCLDVGCGGGHVSLSMASIVGPQGRVIGTDTDGEILALARKDAEGENVANVEFHRLDACVCLCKKEFDLVYARFLLSHLSQPENCLAAMTEACRLRGIIMIEDTDFSGSFCYPTCAAYDRYKELYRKVVQRRGGDPDIGPKLPGMFRRAGIQAVELNVIQPVHIRGEGKLMAPITMSRISDALIAEGLATEEEVQQILNKLNEVAADCQTVMSLPRIFQVWGKRASGD
jgi:SAM-dependent methyltransferase